MKDFGATGLQAVGHPLLTATLALADGDGLLLTGRLSVADQRWVTDHQVGRAIVLPGTAFVELATQAGDRTGCPVVQELTLHAPLTVPEQGTVQLQASVSAPDATGCRA
ncbi:SDR family NAD(P)-dependent oxidoreductase [Kitasatospora sp. Ki12]